MLVADKIIHGSAIFTGLQTSPEKLAIAIKDSQIIATGNLADIKAYQGSETKLIDAGDRLVMAGMHDTHLHLMMGVLLSEYACPLGEVNSLQEAMETIGQFAATHTEREWIFGAGWDHTAWGEKEFPTCTDIDAVIADRPVFLLHAEGHYAWVNTKALEIAQITAETENPNYGVILKDECGEPTGILIETAISLVGAHAYNFSDAVKEEMVYTFMQAANAVGLTSVNDFYMSRAHEQLSGNEVFEKLDQKDALTTRIHLYPKLTEDLTYAKEIQEKYTSSKLKFTGLKQFIDGVVTGYTAYFLDPYKDRPDTKGDISFPKETLQKWVNAADKEGFQIRFHTIGDGAVRLGLDLFENAQKANGVRDARHALEHVEVIATEDIPRFKQLGVQASLQPAHLALMPKESHTTRVDEHKYPYLYPNKTLIDTGALVPYSSDYPIEPLQPLRGVYFAVTRKDFTLQAVWNEQEKISLARALQGYTTEAAKSVFREQELGTIEAGKFADIIILDRNLFAVPTEEILETKVDLTIMHGEIVYEQKKAFSK